MLFKKQPVKTPPDLKWDVQTVEHLTKSDRFDVKITSITKRSGFGATTPNEPMREPNAYEISGVITWPRLILVTVSFERCDDFGFWFYDLYLPHTAPPVALLKLVISDPEETIRRTLYDAHKTAMWTGRLYSLVRFWKRRGDGRMLAKDQAEGYPGSSRYPLMGLYAWSELESPTLPEWAAPYAGYKFSVENLPTHSLRTELQRR
jgi:hypothetical protein